MVRSTRRPASHERSLAARRSRLIPAWGGAMSSATALSPAPMERLATSVRGLRLRDRELCVWSSAIRMLRMLAGDEHAAFTRIGRCDSRPTIRIAGDRGGMEEVRRRPLRRSCAMRVISRVFWIHGVPVVRSNRRWRDPQREAQRDWPSRSIAAHRFPGTSSVGDTGLEPVTSWL
jgi:hypothetical protein